MALLRRGVRGRPEGGRGVGRDDGGGLRRRAHHFRARVFERVGVFDEGVRPFRLAIPDGFSGDAEVRLRLALPDGRESLNGYAVRLHPVEGAMAAVPVAHTITLAAPDARVEAILDRLGIQHTTGAAWPDSGAVVVPPGASYDGDAARAFVEDGGTLLLLEPADTLLPGFPPLYVAPGTNHLVEIVVPSHPVFDGLAQADFDTWVENPLGIPVPRMACLLGEGVLLCRPRYIKGQNQHGMALCEYAVGKGRLLVSTLDATRLWDENGAATRYLRNLIAYVASDAKAPAPSLLSACCQSAASSSPSPDFPIHLSFAACAADTADPPHKILSLPTLARNEWNTLSITFQSDSPDGLIDITIPKTDHSNRLTYTLHTAFSRGKPVTLRLDLAKDFHFVGRDSFPLSEARGEVIFYNGFEKEWTPPFPRPSFNAEIMDIHFE